MRSSVSAWSGSNSATIWPLRITRMRWHSDSSSSASLETTRTPLPRAATAVDDLVDVGAGADVDALGRLVQDHEVGVGLHPLGDHDLLLVAAAEGAGVGLGAALDLVLPDQLTDPLLLRPGVDDPGLGHLRQHDQAHVLAVVEVLDEALQAAVLGQVGDLLRHRRGRGGQAHLLPVELDRAGHGRTLTGDGAGHRRPAAADQPVEADDLAGVDVERHARGPPPP